MSALKIIQLENELAVQLLEGAKVAKSADERSYLLRDYASLMEARTERVNAIPTSIRQGIQALEAMAEGQNIALN